MFFAWVHNGGRQSPVVGGRAMSRGGILREAGEVRHRGGRRHACRLYICGFETLRRNGRTSLGGAAGCFSHGFITAEGSRDGSRPVSRCGWAGYVKRGDFAGGWGWYAAGAGGGARAVSTGRVRDIARGMVAFLGGGVARGTGGGKKRKRPPGGSLRRGALSGGGDLLSRARAQYHRRGRA